MADVLQRFDPAEPQGITLTLHGKMYALPWVVAKRWDGSYIDKFQFEIKLIEPFGYGKEQANLQDFMELAMLNEAQSHVRQEFPNFESFKSKDWDILPCNPDTFNPEQSFVLTGQRKMTSKMVQELTSFSFWSKSKAGALEHAKVWGQSISIWTQDRNKSAMGVDSGTSVVFGKNRNGNNFTLPLGNYETLWHLERTLQREFGSADALIAESELERWLNMFTSTQKSLLQVSLVDIEQSSLIIDSDEVQPLEKTSVFSLRHSFGGIDCELAKSRVPPILSWNIKPRVIGRVKEGDGNTAEETRSILLSRSSTIKPSAPINEFAETLRGEVSKISPSLKDSQEFRKVSESAKIPQGEVAYMGRKNSAKWLRWIDLKEQTHISQHTIQPLEDSARFKDLTSALEVLKMQQGPSQFPPLLLEDLVCGVKGDVYGLTPAFVENVRVIENFFSRLSTDAQRITEHYFKVKVAGDLDDYLETRVQGLFIFANAIQNEVLRAEADIRCLLPPQGPFKTVMPLGDIGPHGVFTWATRSLLYSHSEWLPLIKSPGVFRPDEAVPIDLFDAIAKGLKDKAIKEPQRKLIREINQFQEELTFLQETCTTLRHTLENYSKVLDPNSYQVANERRKAQYQLEREAIRMTIDKIERKESRFKKLAKDCDVSVSKARMGIEIRDEDHGKAIFVFTVVTTIFLPLSFITSYFGMNFADVRDTAWNQDMYWAIAGPTTLAVGATVLIISYSTDELKNLFKFLWSSRFWRLNERLGRKSGNTIPPGGLTDGTSIPGTKPAIVAAKRLVSGTIHVIMRARGRPQVSTKAAEV
ncbi:hypothetical protein BC567DRAFT_275070 [Phyllosticta citribraziliensis]